MRTAIVPAPAPFDAGAADPDSAATALTRMLAAAGGVSPLPTTAAGAKSHESTSGALRSVVVLHLVQLLWSVALAVPALGVVYLQHAALDEALDRVTAAGGDVRDLDGDVIELDETARALGLSTFLCSLFLIVLGSMVCQYAVASNILAGEGREQAELRAYIPQLVALWLAWIVGSSGVLMSYMKKDSAWWLLTLVYLLQLANSWRVAAVLELATERHGLQHLLFAGTFCSWLAAAIDMVLVAIVFDSALEDWHRLLLMALAVPAMFELRLVYVRKLAYAYPGLVVQWPVGVAWATNALHNVVMRTLVLGFENPVLGVAALAVINAALRRTTAWRDRLFCSKEEREVPHAEHARSLLRTVDEVVDSYAVLVALMIALVFRLTHTRHAEEAAPQVQLALVQLGLEPAIDFAVALAVVKLGVGEQRIVARARRALQWPRGYAWYALFWAFSATTCSISLLMTVSYDPSFCAWSRGDHGWTRVPCGSTRAWLSEG